ncbi:MULTISPECIES: RNA polymerase sigma factor [Sphingobacterium]|uniref:RNA polymerase sigma factor n=1 Tax=Sphingobacterium TaxID=28453 RepID=UPI0013DC739F|nr:MULTISPECIES: sigma-70 family RNA polymerase sigma factor [unclassified Sphingobacterium]
MSADIESLLERLRDGDYDAFESLYQTLHHQLIGNLLKLLKSSDLAKEVAQDTFLVLWEQRASIKPDQSIYAYINKIASNKAYNIFRKASHDSRYRAYLFPILAAGYEQIESSFFKKERSEGLHRIIDEMPRRQKEIFTMFKMDGKSYEEIAVELKLSIHTVHTHIKRANQFLKDRIKDDPELFTLVWFALFLPATFI